MLQPGISTIWQVGKLLPCLYNRWTGVYCKKTAQLEIKWSKPEIKALQLEIKWAQLEIKWPQLEISVLQRMISTLNNEVGRPKPYINSKLESKRDDQTGGI